MESLDWHSARALLAWQIEMGADEAILDAPVDRYAEQPPQPAPQDTRPAASPPRAQMAAEGAKVAEVDPVAVAQAAASAAQDLPSLAAAQQAFDHLDLKKGARNFVFADGIPGARVMIVGEAPGRDEDREGRPFVGRAGQLLDRMFAAIDMGRDRADAPLYITNVLPWRPPQNRDPDPREAAMMLPFLKRHIELAAPNVLILMGNAPCEALLGRRGITRMRGSWTQLDGRPVLPMFHPAYLLRRPEAKREAWADLLDLRAWLDRNGRDG